jgi:uncharacterized protein YgiM (DUF1202 family)
MKRILIILFIFSVLVSVSRADELTVQVKSGKVRARPSFLGKIVATLSYGDRVTVIREESEWVLAQKAGSPQGWIHISALTDDFVELSSGTSNAETAASSDELALAGKGFNSDVEAEFKTRNEDVDFTWIDLMEKIIISPEQMEGFLKMGGITVPDGGGE